MARVLLIVAVFLFALLAGFVLGRLDRSQSVRLQYSKDKQWIQALRGSELIREYQANDSPEFTVLQSILDQQTKATKPEPVDLP